MPNGIEGQKCATCYGEGQVPTDEGLASCPDCGGAGMLPSPDTRVEWRLREIESVFGAGLGEAAQAVRWLAFELRQSRGALTEIMAIADDGSGPADFARVRFVANRVLNFYTETPENAS